MYVDPNGNSPFIMGLIISIIVGANIGAVTSGYAAYKSGEKGMDFWWDVLGGLIFGAAIGATTALGGAAGLTSLGAKIAGYAFKTASSVLKVSVALTASAGAIKYSLDCADSSERNWNIGGFLVSGIEGGFQGATSFGIAYIGDRIGLFNVYAKFPTEDTFFLHYGGMTPLRSLIWGFKSLIGEKGSKAIFVSGIAAVIRKIIDWLIPE